MMNANSIWKLESEQCDSGGAIKEGDSVRMKNLKTNMYLSIKKLDQLPYYREELEKIPEIDPTWSNFIVMEKNPSPDSLFIINIFKNQSFKLVTKKLASYDNFYYMYHKKTKDKSD